MVKLIKTPPNKISTSEDLEERERNKAWMPGGPVTPIEENPRAQEHYRRLIAAGIEDINDYPFLMDGSLNPKNRTPLRQRKWGDEGKNIDDNIQAWKLRNQPDELRKKAKAKPKQKRAVKKKSIKRCKCKA